MHILNNLIIRNAHLRRIPSLVPRRLFCDQVDVSQQRHDAKEYLFNNKTSGPAAIINISHVGQKVKQTANTDGTKIEEILNSLGFTVSKTFADSENNTIKNGLQEIAHNINKTPDEHDAFCCFISSFGGTEYFLDKNEKQIYLRELWELFNATNCPGLVLKPKIFIMQVHSDGKPHKAAQRDTADAVDVKVPTEADILAYYGAVPENENNRSMIQLLHNIVTKRDVTKPFDFCKTAVFKVNAELTEPPTTVNQLTKSLIFPATK